MLFGSYRGTSKSTLFGTLRVCISGSFFGYFDGLERSTLKITFQADELFYGVYDKVSLISKIIFRNFYDNLIPKRHNLLNKVKHSVLPRKRISHYRFDCLILSVSSSISSILFY